MNLLLIFLPLLPLVAAHGNVASPAPRRPGAAFGTACGAQVLSVARSDPYGPIELWRGNVQNPSAACNLNICKGLQLADSPAPQRWGAGTNVNIRVDMRARHTGTAKVEIVNARTGMVMGAPLKSWSVYGSTATTPAPDETNFSVRIPAVSGCGAAGNCVLQWWWYSREAGQTYMSCIDFTQ